MIASFKGEYRWLSNFWPCEVYYDGTMWPSVEHAYVAQKCRPEHYLAAREAILKLVNPATVKAIGKKLPMRDNWDDLKVLTMLNLVRCKFTQNQDLREKLLATGDLKLVEGNWWGDEFWGVCKGIGKNHLGNILMMVRNELRGL